MSSILQGVQTLVPGGADVLYVSIVSFFRTPKNGTAIAQPLGFVEYQYEAWLWVIFTIMAVVAWTQTFYARYTMYRIYKEERRGAEREVWKNDSAQKYCAWLGGTSLTWVIVDPLFSVMAFIAFTYSVGEPWATYQRRAGLDSWSPVVAGAVCIVVNLLAAAVGGFRGSIHAIDPEAEKALALEGCFSRVETAVRDILDNLPNFLVSGPHNRAAISKEVFNEMVETLKLGWARLYVRCPVVQAKEICAAALGSLDVLSSGANLQINSMPVQDAVTKLHDLLDALEKDPKNLSYGDALSARLDNMGLRSRPDRNSPDIARSFDATSAPLISGRVSPNSNNH